MQCRAGCGACCRVISIARPYLGMPEGKPAGVACVHLTDEQACSLWGDPRRPDFCAAFAPDPLLCGASRAEAEAKLQRLEVLSLGE